MSGLLPRRTAAIALAAALSVLLSAGPGAAEGNGECAAAPEPIVSLTYVSRYAEDDATRATIDPEREAEVEAALASLDDFIDRLADRTGALYGGSVKDRTRAAECILDQLGAWAEEDALSDLRTETVRLTVGARYAAFALIVWQTLPYAQDHPARARILDWLDRRMAEQIAFWSDAPSGARQGNLRAWAGLAAAALSVQSDRAEFRNWAETSIAEVMCSARPDGSLPQEMSRGRYALHYQLHAIAPLVTATVLLERQGVPASRICDGVLHRIVSFAVSDLIDGAGTREITGVEQNLFDGSDKLEAFQLAWIEPYLLLRESAMLEALRKYLRPMIYTKLGGNQTELWGR